MPDYRLGDVIDDWCIKCRRLTNHAIVSLMNDDAAKVRCRTCYNEHDYRHEQAPPSKKELKKAELAKLAAEAAEADGASADEASEPQAADGPEPGAVADPIPASESLSSPEPEPVAAAPAKRARRA